MASSSAKPEARSLAAAPYNCPDCTKVFARPCDLNKHSKSHTRPFKCQHSDCKYSYLGWPTLKELERHNNDKHSPNPIIYACEYENCEYESKRESNCKQHMEKAHGWMYTRSKSNGKQPADSSPMAPVYRLKPGPHIASACSTPAIKSSSELLPVPNHHQDFTLFQDDTDQSVVFDEEDEDPSHHHDAPQLFPWTSPATRLRRNGTMIERFDQTYHGNQPLRISDIPVDPSLSNLVPQVLASAAVPSNSITCVNNGTNTPETSRQTQSSRQQSSRAPRRQRRRNSDAAASRKRFKLDPSEGLGDDEGFTDSTMPCIFRHSHPHLYNKETRDKSDPCHTPHRDISTLARHLLRPAHRLSVDPRMISSFEIQDSNYLHPRVGLCRRCWQPFFDPLAFQNHVDLECEKVSKGKREKWRIMRDLFTPLVQQHNEQSRLSPNFDMEGQENAVYRTKGSIRTIYNAGDNAHQGLVSGTVAPTNHGTLAPSRTSLESEIQKLREENRQLKESLVTRESRQESLASTVHSSAIHHASEMASGLGLVSAPRIPTSKDSNSDQESLVGYMDSQSTDVDRDGLMSETPETFMRQRPGLNLPSHSSVHHVPTSPSSVLNDSFQDVPNFSQPSTSVLLFSARKNPTSLADSAYGTCTDPRRGSLGEPGQAAVMADISGGPHKNWFNNLSQQRQDGGSFTLFGDYQFGNNGDSSGNNSDIYNKTIFSSTPRVGPNQSVATIQQRQAAQQQPQQDFSGWSNPNPFATASTSQPSHGLFEDASFDFFMPAQTDCGEETGGYNPTSSSQDFVFPTM
ncbi:hypothetical protein SMACR_05359 [Sordaria macrospora]|uniref:C2H2-type domain-containing protein n=1 Tax=Sordaria macrospora TaxID=5147 RepID=A0A8S8ZN16_SORMA|nr:hypothetical protein SMACR_05359 [Sordaria macrospora]KAH7632104.1 hypothetical protein B0T09DRAFT_382188 [Sordaria sp. MPI-SDFR-AT-0083]WPJ63391.1 hypothetical protein SMAC4_05359 [Sordaria macrospora]